MSAIISVKGLVKDFAGLRAVDGLDFEVQEGEVYGLLGPNGAGKTTTIKMIACVLPVDGGTLLVGGLDVRTRDE